MLLESVTRHSWRALELFTVDIHERDLAPKLDCSATLCGRRAKRALEMISDQVHALAFIEAMRVLAPDRRVKLKPIARKLLCALGEPAKELCAVSARAFRIQRNQIVHVKESAVSEGLPNLEAGNCHGCLLHLEVNQAVSHLSLKPNAFEKRFGGEVRSEFLHDCVAVGDLSVGLRNADLHL